MATSLFATPDTVISPPGTLLLSESLTNPTMPEGAEAWRIEYTTTAPNGSPTTAFATVLAPNELPDDPMRVIAWDHGAVGLVQRCLPSTSDKPWKEIPALAEVVAHDWIIVATDYETDASGVHPFLIGEGEARSTLDAVRALRQMHGLKVDEKTVVWGHSQGGHAALWTGIIAGTYAPDITISGVVAISPATSLVSMLGRQSESSVAPLLGSWLATSYSAYYPAISYDSIVTPAARDIGRQLASRCPAEPLDGAAVALLIGELGDQPLLVVPATEAFGDLLKENEPVGNVAAPVLIAQGLDDIVVLPETTADFVAARCTAGATLTFWQLPGQDHLSLVQPGSPLEAPLIDWTQQRFAGATPAPACSTDVIGAKP